MPQWQPRGFGIVNIVGWDDSEAAVRRGHSEELMHGREVRVEVVLEGVRSAKSIPCAWCRA